MLSFEEVMLEVSLKNLELQSNKYKDMDNKAIAITTIAGVLVTLLLGSNTVLKSDSKVSWILFSLTIFSFLITLFFCIFVIRVRSTDTLSSKLLIEDFSDKKEEINKIRGVISTVAEAEDNLIEVCEKKGHELKNAIITFLFSIILLILYTVSIIH